MNEFFFLLHTLFLITALRFFVRFGKLGVGSYVAFCILCANIFVIKQISLFGLNITASDPFTIASFLSINLIQEWYGKEFSKKTLFVALSISFFFLGATQLHLLYQPSDHDTTHKAFSQLFSYTPRIILSSLAIFFVSQKVNLALFGWMKKKITTISLATRLAIALLLSQLLDTVLFSYVALYGLVAHIGHIILVSFTIKTLVILFSHPLTRIFHHVTPPEKDYA